MGGNAIEGAMRISTRVYKQYIDEIVELLPKLTMRPVLPYRQKLDHGDIDMVVRMGPHISTTGDIKEYIFGIIQPAKIHDNRNCYSVAYKGVQVDFILAPPEEYETTLNYFHYNDLGNLIGRVARAIGFKYGHLGLLWEYHLGEHEKIDILVSTDMREILTFLGYDPDVWFKGFDSEWDILSYASSSKYFNPRYFDLDEQNHDRRVRNAKRKVYAQMLMFIEHHGWKSMDPLTDEELKGHFMRGVMTFGQHIFYLPIGEANEMKRRRDITRKVFNGDIVANITKLEGKRLGQFMQYYKTFTRPLKFFEHIDTHENLAEDIYQVFQIWADETTVQKLP